MRVKKPLSIYLNPVYFENRSFFLRVRDVSLLKGDRSYFLALTLAFKAIAKILESEFPGVKMLNC